MNSQIMVNNVSNSDSALLWGGCGNGFTAQPVLPNTTDSRVCGVQSQNLSVLQPCCNGAELQQYQCWTYCKYPGDILDFSRCLGNDTQVFCQSGQRSNLTESLKTSFGFKSYSAPRMSWVVLALLFAILFVNPSSATIIPSLDNSGIVRRQSTSCTFSKDQVYGYSGRQIRVSSDIGCSARMCPQPYSVDTGIDNNNRTINGTSAADPKYDQIFEIVGNATGRLFPAQSSVNITQEVIVLGGQSGYLSWVPQHFCTNGTVTNCKGVLGDSNDAIYQEFCGPIFAGDAMGNGTDNTIQGSFIFVTTE